MSDPIPTPAAAEPNEAMLNAARDWSIKKYGRGIGNDAAIGCWQAMYRAAAASQCTAIAAQPVPDATPAQQAEPVWDAYRDDWVHEDDPAPVPDATPAQQEEWRLVPVKPHIDMIEAALDLKHEDGAPHEIVMCDCWSAMVAAAPRQDAATPAQQVSAAGSEPVAWRYRNAGWPQWRYCDLKPTGAYDIVEPLYAMPTPALAPQDGDRGLYDEGYQAGKKVGISQGRRLAARVEPDLLPGLKRAEELLPMTQQGDIRIAKAIHAEIARIEKERQS